MSLLSRASEIDDDTEARKINDDVEEILTKISEECAKENKNVSEFITDPNDGVNQAKMWKIKQKLVPKNGKEPPVAKRDKNGNLVTGKNQIKRILVDNSIERLSPNKMEESLEEIENLKEKLYELRLNSSKDKKTADWSSQDFEKVLRCLPNGKSRDLQGHTYELFEYGGNSLKHSLLRLANLIKSTQIYPKILQAATITSI